MKFPEYRHRDINHSPILKKVTEMSHSLWCEVLYLDLSEAQFLYKIIEHGALCGEMCDAMCVAVWCYVVVRR